ncbi:LysE family translocator [Nesterenkonia sp. K-15-9-6]|uniref:LysE family translocator n=1 Tax=Nesterenkonia sp. K-15-9-6 TaxID=3093918 RepID=UPI0040444C0B
MTLSSYLAFLGVAAILAVTPGPDTFLALRYAMAGRRPGLLAATGSSAAIFAWAALAAAGVAAALRSSTTAYYGLTLLGGTYLIIVGARALHAAREARASLSATSAPVTPATHAHGPRADAEPARTDDDAAVGPSGAVAVAAPPRIRNRTALLAGVTTCLTNPKTGLFFIALFPQFTSAEMSVPQVTFALGGTVALCIFLYLIAVVVLADAARRWLARPAVTHGIQAVSGAVLGGLGVYMVATALPQLM